MQRNHQRDKTNDGGNDGGDPVPPDEFQQNAKQQHAPADEDRRGIEICHRRAALQPDAGSKAEGVNQESEASNVIDAAVSGRCQPSHEENPRISAITYRTMHAMNGSKAFSYASKLLLAEIFGSVRLQVFLIFVQIGIEGCGPLRA